MKILIVTQTFPLTPQDSTAAFMYDFSRGFSEIGEEVIVLVPFHPSLKANLFEKIKVVSFKYIWPDSFHLLGFGRTLENDQKLRWFVYLLAPLYYLFGTLALFRLVKRERPNVINAHWILPGGFISGLIAMLTGVPLVITLAGSDVFISRQNFLFKTMSLFAKKRALQIVSNSPQLLADLDTLGEVISYGVPVNPGRRIVGKRLTIATAGRAIEKKGFDILKKIFPEIEIISGLPIDVFRKKLLEVDIFIALSIRDSKGNLDDASLTVLEAMAAGCAVVVSDLPGYRLFIKNGSNGILVSSKNSLAVVRAVNHLIFSQKSRFRLGKNARLTISHSLTPPRTAEAYINFFSGVLWPRESQIST